MFSTGTLHIRIRKFFSLFLCVGSFLLLVEIAFRTWDWFYDYNGWESPGLMQKMEDAQRLYEEKGRIDLVVLSSSVGRVIDIHQWEEATSGALVAYNFGFPDQRPERQNFLFQKHIWPRYKPTHVIYGVSVPDCNSNVRGKHPDRPRDGPFWTYRNMKAYSARTSAEKWSAALSEASVLFRSRQRARFTLQYGTIAMLPREPVIGRGVIAPTVIRQEFGPQIMSWALDPLGIPYNCYWDYWAPPDGEIGEIAKLADFCRQHNVQLAVVEIPTSPYAHTNFNAPDGYNRFLQSLFTLIDKDIPVIPMGQQLQLDNTLFEDQDHLNRWGGQIITNFIYQHVIRKWFSQRTGANELPAPVQIPVHDRVTSETGVLIKRCQPVTSTAEYASDLQVVVTDKTDIVLTTSLSSGSYAVELYAGDGSTTAPELLGEAVLQLVVVDETGETVDTLPLKWINSRIGISYTQAFIDIPVNGGVVLQVTQLGNRPIILDTAFIRPRLSDVNDNIVLED